MRTVPPAARGPRRVAITTLVLAFSVSSAALAQPAPSQPGAAAAQPGPALTPTPSVVTLEPDPAGTSVGAGGGSGAAEYQQGGGFILHTPDDRYVLTIGGRIQADARTFPYFGADSGPSSGVSFRRARVELAGTVLRCLHWQLWLDLAKGTTAELLDAFLQWVPVSRLRIWAGHFVTPFGLERTWSALTLPFMERSVALSTNAPDSRRLGVMVDWQLRDEVFYAALGVFRGSALSTSPAPDLVEDFDVMARMFVQPFRGEAMLHLGVAGTIGRHEGDGAQALLNGQTMFGHRWFPGDSDDAIRPDGMVARVGGELDFSWNRFRLSGEVLYTRVDHADRDEDAESLGAYGTLTATLLGEPFSRKHTRGIRHVDLESGHAHLRGISDSDVPWTLELAAGLDWTRIEASLESTAIGGIRTEATYTSGRFQLNFGRSSWLRFSLMYAFGLFGDDARPALVESGEPQDVVHELGGRAQVAF